MTLYFTVFRVKWVQSGYRLKHLRERQATTRGFTSTRIATLPVGRYKDPGQKSLYLLVRGRVDGRLTKTWLHRIKLMGADTFLQLGHFPETSLEVARDEIRRQRELLSKGIDPRRAAPRRQPVRAPQTLSATTANDQHSVEFLVSEFTERYLRRERKRPQYAESILHRDVLRTWAGRDARTIEPHDVIALTDAIVERGAPVMANRTAALLDQLFLFGVQRQIVKASPVQLLYAPGGKEKPRQRAWSDDEIRAFLHDPLGCTRGRRLAHVVTVLLLTGARRGELAAARWSHVDFEAKTWTVPLENSKNGREHVKPLCSWALDEFKRLKKAAGASPWVLPGIDPAKPVEPLTLSRGPARCRERFAKAGIAAFTLHDLRRTMRTGLSRLGIAPHVGELCLGHSLGKMHSTYDTHTYLSEQRIALERWADHLERMRQ